MMIERILKPSGTPAFSGRPLSMSVTVLSPSEASEYTGVTTRNFTVSPASK